MPDSVGWRRAVVVFMSAFLMSFSWIGKSREAVSQRRSSPKGFFSPAEDALKRRITYSKTILPALPAAVYGTLVQCV